MENENLNKNNNENLNKNDNKSEIETRKNNSKNESENLKHTEEKLKNDELKQEKAPLGERIGDGVEDFFDGLQDFVYGERKSINEDIPATFQTDSGRRKVLKYATRKNINRKLFANKKFVKGIFIFIGVVITISALYGIAFMLLK